MHHIEPRFILGKNYLQFSWLQVWNACKSNTEDSDQPIHEMDLLSGHENDVNYVQFRSVAVVSGLCL